MYRLARSGGARELLHWVSGRAAGWAGLLDGDGTVLHGVTRGADGTGGDVAALAGVDAAALAGEYAKDLSRLEAHSFAFDRGPHTALLFPLDGPPDAAAPILAVVAPRPLPDGLAVLLSDVAMPLAMCWAAETVERKRLRVDLAESRSREAVLHLLMTGQLSIAHQVAGALRPTLPDPVRVYVVECPSGRRDEVARICEELSGGRSWIVRCPVYARHLILVVPADADAAEQRLGLRAAEVVPECVVGVSENVPLPDTATGYRQAFHALAVARGLPERHARFGSAPDPAVAAGADGARWADELLHPLLTHLPRRSQDPGSQELAATLASWLAFASHATLHLKIHRNTLAARLRLIGELLGLDLNRVGDQAALDLALRIRATPAGARSTHREEQGARPPFGLDDILRGPAVREWAAQQLRPLTASGTSRTAADPRATLRTWLECEAQLGATADALGISVPGARKRLARLESILQRSLLQAPSARYDLWLAFRALDVAGADGAGADSGGAYGAVVGGSDSAGADGAR
ncbi:MULTISPECIES: helix-turn-helix domain-containing protein [unclassified Streptomyces]|uniref:helix-turn-helix domain-containing protein n=1 Tax=unclassified Streptomyces TaxID=2593676 RepID=UPI002E791ED2|nr:helix-turn-helix domain-containing protein [Streptomyces sp. JV184]MEE1748754.1 helix-turn-helix domain-containing protein [Streptomyces sp. JV184]